MNGAAGFAEARTVPAGSALPDCGEQKAGRKHCRLLLAFFCVWSLAGCAAVGPSEDGLDVWVHNSSSQPLFVTYCRDVVDGFSLGSCERAAIVTGGAVDVGEESILPAGQSLYLGITAYETARLRISTAVAGDAAPLCLLLRYDLHAPPTVPTRVDTSKARSCLSGQVIRL
jgi:hypothetical protein